jgi:hypothetical protein
VDKVLEGPLAVDRSEEVVVGILEGADMLLSLEAAVSGNMLAGLLVQALLLLSRCTLPCYRLREEDCSCPSSCF